MYSPTAQTDQMYVRHGIFLSDIDAFDHKAFRLNVNEALAMDPQQRILLEEVCLALHDARESCTLLDQKTGIYVGCMYQEYTQLQYNFGVKIHPAVVTGNGISYLVGRVAYTFGFSGPAVSTDTACSSSLVACHMAHTGLLAGETTGAVAAGVNTMLLPITTASISGMSALSPVARCKTFDASADGYGRGEGFAVLTLCPITETEVLPILLLRGTGVNQDGRSSGLTAPNGPSQTELIRDVMNSAEASPGELAYVALHGTGTPLGDPIEVNALGQALHHNHHKDNHSRSFDPATKRSRLALGSVKSCLGHTEGAAGLTGAFLAIRGLMSAEATPIMHLRTMNPYVSSALADWKKKNVHDHIAPRQSVPFAGVINEHSDQLAGTSSFGMGGTNAHAMLSSQPSNEQSIRLGADKRNAKALNFDPVRLWPIPPCSHLLTAIVGSGRGVGQSIRVAFALDLLRPAVGYLFDHTVNGNAILPGAAFFDIALTSGVVLSSLSNRNDTLVASHCSLTSPLLLSRTYLHVTSTIDLLPGTIQIGASSSGGPSYLTGRLNRIASSSVVPGHGPHQPGNVSSLRQSLLYRTMVLEKRLFPRPFNVVGCFALRDEPHLDVEGHCLPPAILDASMHIAVASKPTSVETGTGNRPMVPAAAEGILYLRSGQGMATRTAQQSTAINLSCSIPVDMNKMMDGTVPQSVQTDHAVNSRHFLGGIAGLISVPLERLPSGTTQSPFASQVTNSDPRVTRRMEYTEMLPVYVVQHYVEAVYMPQQHVSLPASMARVPVVLGLSSNHAESSASSVVRVRGASGMEDSMATLLNALQTGQASGVQEGLRRGFDTVSTIHLGSIANPQQTSFWNGSSFIGATGAGAWGLLRVAASEKQDTIHTGIDRDVHDVSSTPSDRDINHVTALIASSLIDGVSGTAVRGRALYRPLLLPVPVAAFPVGTVGKAGNHANCQKGRTIITGGMGGLGILVASWLSTEYSLDIVLLGRSVNAPAANQLVAIANDKSGSSRLAAAQCDISAVEDVHACLDSQVEPSGNPLAQVIHAGGVLLDGVFARQNAKSLRKVMAPKLGFLKLADMQIRSHPIQTAMVFSSLASFIGSPGQANYAAANAVLDSWAATSQLMGQASNAVRWGAWADVGMAHGNDAVLQRVKKSGLGVLRPAVGLAVFASLLSVKPSAALVETIASDFDFKKLLQPLSMPPAIFDDVLAESQSHSYAITLSKLEHGQPHSQESRNSIRMDTKKTMDTINNVISSILGVSIFGDQPLMEAGMDSLMAVTIRSELESAFKTSLPSTIMFDYPTLSALTTFFSASLEASPTGHTTENMLGLAPVRVDTVSVLFAVRLAGISCRFGQGVESQESFYGAMQSTSNLQGVTPYSRWDVDELYSPTVGYQGQNITVRFAAYLSEIDMFDARLFSIQAQEAMLMDPQHRLLLEETFKASVFSLLTQNQKLVEPDTGVYVGCMYHEFTDVLSRAGAKLSIPMLTGNSSSFMVGRLSYTFGFSGPCISTDTACSSSLVATHLGAKALQAREVERAAVAGVNLILSPTTTVALCTLQALSSDGRCKTFDSTADGYGRGEGCIVVMLDRLPNINTASSESIILRSTALNQDGRSSSLTSPNGPAQAALIRTAMHGTVIADSTPAQLSYIAAHGTGTALGDPIEVNALSLAMSDHSKNGLQPCLVNVGSVKACYGHTEGAAGLTGLLLATAASMHDSAPPLMHLRRVNPYVESALSASASQAIQSMPREFKPHSTRAWNDLAGTSSFGMSGVNAHAIVNYSHQPSQPAEGLHMHRDGAHWQRSRHWPVTYVPHCYYFTPSTKSFPIVSYGCGTVHVDCATSRCAALASVMMGVRVLSAAIALHIMRAAARLIATQVGDIALINAVCHALPLAGMEGGAGMYNEQERATYLRCTLEPGASSIRLTILQQNIKEDTQSEAHAEARSLRLTVQPANVPGDIHRCSLASKKRPLLLLNSEEALSTTSTANIDTNDAEASNEQALIPLAHQAAMTLASTVISPRHSLVVQGCAVFVDSIRKLGFSKIVTACASLTQASIEDGSCMFGLVAKPLTSIAVSIPRRASWESSWYALDLQRVPLEKSLVPWVAISAQPICARQLLTEPSMGLHRCAALNVLWTSAMEEQGVIDAMNSVDIAVGCQDHLEWLLHASLLQHCLFVDVPQEEYVPSPCRYTYPTQEQLEAAQIQGMLATVQAVLACDRQLKVSLVTVNARTIEPFTVQPRTRVALLTGIANTVFMEQRGSFGPLIDIDSAIPFDMLASILSALGEFSVAVRGGRTYVLRLTKSSNDDFYSSRRIDHVKSAFVAGGTKVGLPVVC